MALLDLYVRRFRCGRLLATGAVTVALAAACSGGSDGPGDEPIADLLPNVTHVLEPTDQMRAAAEQQCLDDPELDEGYVRAVSPDTDEVMAEISVVCAEVRGN